MSLLNSLALDFDDVKIFIHVELESHALDLVLLTWETKQKEEEEKERRKRRRDPWKNQTHSMKSPAKPNPSMAKPNLALCCHLYLWNQNPPTKKSFLLLLCVLQIKWALFAPKHKSSVLDSISLVEIKSNKLEMLVC